MSLHHPLQLLKCFGVGLALTILLTLAIGLLAWVFMWAEKYERRFALWLAGHRLLLKGLQISGIVFLAACLAFALTAFGCSIMEAM